MSEIFLREQMLIGQAAVEKLWGCHVAVLGLGGVGSWCAEALARSGVGELTVVDEDVVSTTNINRQLIATCSTVSMYKASVLERRIKDISPKTTVNAKKIRYEAATRDEFFSQDYDYIVDAIDLVTCKLDLILSAMERGVPIISALGTGNKLRAELFQICDISKTTGCPLARVVRRELRAKGVLHHKVVYSPELARTPEQLEAPAPGRRSTPGSIAWVPASAGLLLAQEVVLALSGISEKG